MGSGGLKIAPAVAGLAWAAAGSASGSAGCWPNLRRGRLLGSTSGWAVPPCPCGPCTGGSARSPGGGGPRLVAKGDPNREAVLASLHHAIGELPEGAVVLAEDETHINLLPWVRATWIAKGTRQQVMTPGTNRRRTIFGAVDLHTGRWFYQVARKAVSATFIAFLNQLAAGYPAAPTVAVVCDNVIIHHSKIVQRWLATSPTQILATATPSSSPWMPEGYMQNFREAA
jgi:hypothetical protein